MTRKQKKSNKILQRKRQKRALKEARRAKTTRTKALEARKAKLIAEREELFETVKKELIEKWEKEHGSE